MPRKIKILPLVPRNKVAPECRTCSRYSLNKEYKYRGKCGGRESLVNMCLAYKA